MRTWIVMGALVLFSILFTDLMAFEACGRREPFSSSMLRMLAIGIVLLCEQLWKIVIWTPGESQ